MAVDAAGLEDDLETLFAAPPATIALCAADWADAVEAYATGVVPPSAAVAAAAATLEGAMVTAFGTPAAGPGLDTAFVTFAATVFGGMPPMSPAAPAGPPGFPAAFLVPAATHAEGAANFKVLIDVWFTSTGWS
jgi:hypothetical protein